MRFCHGHEHILWVIDNIGKMIVIKVGGVGLFDIVTPDGCLDKAVGLAVGEVIECCYQ